MEVSETAGGLQLVNDAYNANPDSMTAGLKAARWIARDRRLVAVLGHMAELGSVSAEEHDALGRLVTRIGVDRLVTVGGEAEAIARAALFEGMEPDAVRSVGSAPEAARSPRITPPPTSHGGSRCPQKRSPRRTVWSRSKPIARICPALLKVPRTRGSSAFASSLVRIWRNDLGSRSTGSSTASPGTGGGLPAPRRVAQLPSMNVPGAPWRPLRRAWS
jgi:hypothetical protein